MKKSLLVKIVSVILVVVGFVGSLSAQVTTSSMSGTIRDAKGVLPGAGVKATHTPTGTIYSVSTNADGRFNLANMRVGGPYVLEISFVGFNTQKNDDIFLKLGENYSINATLTDNSKQLSEVVVKGTKEATFNGKRTGAATNIGKDQIETLPTLNRSLQDFTRLTPQASGNSFGGANNRFNNITIDGAINNDVFGLSSSGTPGGQASTQPISLDAIQEIQVVLAPYDVTQGNFTGGGVNAVTRSGTNNFEGSLYFFGRNENTGGKNVLTNERSADFLNNQYGFRLGGPLVKNKLFFFVNAESQRIKAPLLNNAGENGSALTVATANQIADHINTTYGYDVGAFNATNNKTENNKLFAKLDWNINAKNQLTVRYNYIDAFDDNLSRSLTSFRFGNNAYKFTNTQHNGVLELRSNINDKMSNNLILGYSRIRDRRATAGALFPQITIQNLEGVSGAIAELGTQRSSAANELDQDIFEFTNNFKVNVGKHSLTFGTHNEFFKFRNLFINDANGRWDFNNLADLIANRPNRVRATYSVIPGDNRPSAEFNAAQLSVYGQDEFDAFKGFKLTLGLRVDLPVFGDGPGDNPKVSAAFPGYNTANTMKSNPLFSPRLGFNYDVTGDRAVQLRGGTGIFTGRVPFVWLSNQYSNSGLLFGQVDVTRNANGNPNLVFNPDPNNQQASGPLISRAQINLVDPNFKIPQVFRTNLAVDVKLPYGILGTLEGIYSKTLNNIVYKDINIRPSTAAINPTLSGGADTRAQYLGGNAGKVDNPNFTNVILLENTNKGYTYNITAQLQKNFDFGLSAMVAYTNTEAKSINDGSSSTAVSNWEFVQHVNDPNNPNLAYSNFMTRHRIIGSLNYKINYGKNKEFGTGVSLFYAGRSGQRFTYLYNGDLNGDGAFSNDLLFVPENQSQIKLIPLAASGSNPALTADQQWANLDAFIAADPYLKTRRGQYTERNGAISPFEHQFDFRLTQDLGAIVKGTKNKLQLTFDIFNVGNLINKDWGRQYFVTNQALTLVNYVAQSNNAPGSPGFTFRAPSNNLGYQTSGFGSAWSGQFGVRYIFN